MYEPHEDMLMSRDKGIAKAKNLLALLFRKILHDRGIGLYEWGYLMNRYLSDPVNCVAKNVKDRSSVRGNLNKELRKDRMTFKVFHKGLRFLRPISVRFIVQIKWSNHHPISEHFVDLPVGRHEDHVDQVAMNDLDEQDE